MNLSTKYRVEKYIGSIETKDSERLGVYFSPVDVINEDIIFTLSDLDLEDKLGDPRDNTRETYDKYGGLKQTADKYWRKYNGSNNFWDYLRLINYFPLTSCSRSGDSSSTKSDLQPGMKNQQRAKPINNPKNQ